MISHVHDIDGAILFIHGDASGEIELAVGIPKAAPCHDKLAGSVELLYAEVRAVHDVDVAALVVDGDAPRRVKLAVSAALPAPLRQICAVPCVKTLDSVIAGITYVHDIFL